MLDQVASVTLTRPLSVLPNVCSDDRVPPTSVFEQDVQEGGDVVVGAMVYKVVQHDRWTTQAGLDVLFHSACDENAEGYKGIPVEEREHPFDELLNFSFVIALVQPIQYDERWAL